MPNFTIEDNQIGMVLIKVVGVGGAGGNAINRMIQYGMLGVEFVAMNTDQKALDINKATQKVLLGEKLTKGFGAGSDPEIGRRAAEESTELIAETLKGARMVFVTAGMGGGTGTGAAPVVAKIARDMGILTVAIVTKPFAFEGRKKKEIAEMGIAALRECVDSIIIIPNERLKLISEERITFNNAFEVANNVLRQAVQSVSDLINVTSIVNLDFNDVEAVMRDAGYAHMGVGRAGGRDKAELAAEAAISSPLLETTINGATGVIINITSSPEIDLYDVEQAAAKITAAAHPDALIIWGAGFDDSLNDEMVITVIATSPHDADALNVPLINKGQPAPQPAAPAQPEPEREDDSFDFDTLLGILNNRDNSFNE